MSKLHLSETDVEKLIKWLEYIDNIVSNDINSASDIIVDSIIDKHYEIDYLIQKLKR